VPSDHPTPETLLIVPVTMTDPTPAAPATGAVRHHGGVSHEALDRLRELSSGEGLGRRALDRSRGSLRTRVDRLRSRAFQVGQCALAATVAWLLATRVVGHETPFFAPVAAVVALGLTYGNRLTRVAEVVVGVAVGVGVGDLFVNLVGTGVWQIAVVVAASMSVAVLLGAGTVLTTQAGVQAVFVTTLIPDPEAGLSRWVDAVTGGLVALGIAAVVPSTPLRRPRRLMAGAVAEIHELLLEAATSASDGDVQRATRALERARNSQQVLEALRSAASESLDVVRLSPLRRRHLPVLRDLAGRVEPLDRAVRNVRVLLRRVTVVAWRGEHVPPATITLLRELADAAEVLARDLADGRDGSAAVPSLVRAGRTSAQVPVGMGLSSDVVLAQCRAMVVDLLAVSGVSQDDALRGLPPEQGRSPAATGPLPD